MAEYQVAAFDLQEGLAFCAKYGLTKQAESDLIDLLSRAMAATECVIPEPRAIALEASVGKGSDFEAFWDAYPRKVAKGAARKAWKATAGIRPAVEYLLLAIEDQKQPEGPLHGEKKFMPHGSTWLRAEQWDDEVNIDRPADGPTPQERLKALREKRAIEAQQNDRKRLGKELGKLFKGDK